MHGTPELEQICSCVDARHLQIAHQKADLLRFNDGKGAARGVGRQDVRLLGSVESSRTEMANRRKSEQNFVPDIMTTVSIRLLRRCQQPDVLTANSARRALTIIETEKVRLLVCDLKMPRIDGSCKICSSSGVPCMQKCQHSRKPRIAV